MNPILELAGVSKTFTMHLQGGIVLPVVADVTFALSPAECAILAGPSGAGKSSILKMIFGSYRCDRGQILVRDGLDMVDIASAGPRRILKLRHGVIGYVSQFLRAVPRVAAIDVVAEPLVVAGRLPEAARARAGELLERLNVAPRMWMLPPATFSGGEQQRVNVARGFLPDLPLLLLDEPTASLDAENRAVVVDLIAEKKRRGTAIVAIAHDHEVRSAIADRLIDVTRFASACSGEVATGSPMRACASEDSCSGEVAAGSPMRACAREDSCSGEVAAGSPIRACAT
jgi:alpha-D-ribose 1-methylphosphonate 5-triphosphate synthase subunit PhnL